MKCIMLKFIVVLLLALCLRSSDLMGQALPLEYIVQLKQSKTEFELEFRKKNEGRAFKLSLLSATMKTYWLGLDKGKDLLEVLRSMNSVQTCQRNYKLTPRTVNWVPNDPLFNRQWHLKNPNGADVDAESAWNSAKGGLTAMADTPVVCIIDSGFEWAHPDLQPNAWRNYLEIPDNGHDDDQNGYIDDYKGWSSTAFNDQIDKGSAADISHGTAVWGAMSAKGDNALGVTGLAPELKTMCVQYGSDLTTANVLRAFEYPLKMRQLYQKSGGAKGAFVVAINASWGRDFGTAADEPLWCAMYDTLGAYGILTVSPGPNTFENVDAVGDLPTTCPSPFLIAVSPSDQTDQRTTFSCYGPTSIDLFAPGKDVYSTKTSGAYGPVSGGSQSAPLVVATIALLYSSACSGLAYMAHSKPHAAALLAREAIIQGVEVSPNFSNLCVTEGRLNANNSINYLATRCPNLPTCSSPLRPRTLWTKNDSVGLAWVNPTSADSTYWLIFKPENGRWDSVFVQKNNAVIKGLQLCTSYQAYVRRTCGGSVSSQASSTLFFKTDKCCNAPTNLRFESIDNQTIRMAWASVSEAQNYHLRYWPIGQQASTSTSVTLNATVSQTTLTNLWPCTNYTFQLVSECPANAITLTASPAQYTYQTLGCGSACLSAVSCSPNPPDSESEWIERVNIGSWQNQTGSSHGRLQLYRAGNLSLVMGETYNFTITPGFAGQPSNLYSKIWLDLNNNGQLEEPAELLFSTSTGTSAAVSDVISIPMAASEGLRLLRISSRWNSAPEPCNDFGYGEFEDYCVLVNQYPLGITPSKEALDQVYPNPTTGEVNLELNRPDLETQVTVYNALGSAVLERNINQYDVQKIDLKNCKSGIYYVKIKNEFVQNLYKLVVVE